MVFELYLSRYKKTEKFRDLSFVRNLNLQVLDFFSAQNTFLIYLIDIIDNFIYAKIVTTDCLEGEELAHQVTFNRGPGHG